MKWNEVPPVTPGIAAQESGSADEDFADLYEYALLSLNHECEFIFKTRGRKAVEDFLSGSAKYSFSEYMGSDYLAPVLFAIYADHKFANRFWADFELMYPGWK